MKTQVFISLNPGVSFVPTIQCLVYSRDYTNTLKAWSKYDTTHYLSLGFCQLYVNTLFTVPYSWYSSVPLLFLFIPCGAGIKHQIQGLHMLVKCSINELCPQAPQFLNYNIT
jgi:hypothetical protein